MSLPPTRRWSGSPNSGRFVYCSLQQRRQSPLFTFLFGIFLETSHEILKNPANSGVVKQLKILSGANNPIRSSIKLLVFQQCWWMVQSKYNHQSSDLVMKKKSEWFLKRFFYGSRVKWSNPGKGVAPSPTPWCSSYRKGGLRVTLDYDRLYLLYILSRLFL